MTERTSELLPPYDSVDAKIVDVLRHDGRLSIPALADRVGISRATAYARYDRLIRDGVVSGFRAIVKPSSRGLTVAALVLIDAEQPLWDETLQHLRRTTGVEWVGIAAGAFDFVALVRAADLTDLRDVVLQGLRAIPGLKSTRTAILLDEDEGISVS